MATAILDVLSVFTASDGSGGNPLGVFVDGGLIPPERRQSIAAELGYSETVFVDDLSTGAVVIKTPATELPFAGHPLVGTSWLLMETGHDVAVLRPPAGEVPTWRDGEVVWIRAKAEWAPDVEFRQLASPEAVEAEAPARTGFVIVWAWIDEAAGLVRSRAFAPDVGIVEDEATGSAAARMVAMLGRPIEIRQGRGSVLHARLGPEGTAEVGGRVARLDQRPFAIS